MGDNKYVRLRARLKNRRVTVYKEKNGDGYKIYFSKIIKDEDPNEPCARHRVYKGKLKVTGVSLTTEAFEALIAVGLQLMEIDHAGK